MESTTPILEEGFENSLNRGKAGTPYSALSDSVESLENKRQFFEDRLSQPPNVFCPECGAKRFEDGVRNIQKDGSKHQIRNFHCKVCGRDFLDPSASISLKKPKPNTCDRRVCAEENQAKNLVKEETRQKWAVGATVDLPMIADQFQGYLVRKQLKESSIKTYLYAIRFLVKMGADIFDPDNVNYVMGQQKWSDGRKDNIIKAYTHLARMLRIESKWDRPKMNPQKGHPRPPSTEQVITIWSGASRKYCVIFKFMAQTGAIAVEVSILTEKNFDFERNEVFIKGCKGHKDRWVPLYLFGSELPGLMKEYLNCYGSFSKNTTILAKFRKYRDRTARKTGDNSLKNVRCEDLRHWFATEYYRRYRDPYLLQDYMGHEKHETTRIYTKVVPAEKPSYVTRPVTTVEEGLELGEHGWERYDEIDGVHLYRRQKTFEELTLEKRSGTSEKGPWSSLV